MTARHASSSSSSSPATATATASGPTTATPAAAADSTLEMLQRKHLNGRLFTFNRPAAFNALNLDMIRTMTPQLKAWESSDACNVILLRSDHKKAFCAGGDVKTLVEHINKGEFELATQFMKEEYQLNHMIATTPKPFVALCDGITMGGGVGLSVHAPFRVATEKTVFAMPETAIGLFPDVGGTFFLPRLDGELGTYLALTGDRLVGSDVVAARVATHFVPSERMPALTDRLCELEVSDWGVVNAAIEEFAEAVPAGGMAINQHRQVIDKCFKGDSIDAICKALELDGSTFALKTLDTLKSMSPMSLHVTLKQIRKGKQLDVAQAFQFEWALVNNVLRHPDFVEGVTAKLINKSATMPAWPSAKQTPEELASLLVPMQHLPALPLARPTTYDQYPHRFLALPAEADVRSVVKGEEQHVGDFAFMSVDEVVEFFATHWPFRHLVADGIKDLNAMRRNAAGANTHQAAPIGDLEMQVGAGKVGVREHVREIVERCCSVDEVKGVKWVWGEAK
ncbi:ClpP/crotonase-like domain-containing protein [Catenaria anguillulae PL171]|uniref:3-hydroxyisobutyryl-CoA hydrolase n=1 Tax=Catenaria anguillulae PL171 TaxID=765915 RepID=A0A1Y2HMB7_9FUNG|nr:ClpP/crotonase-like domain-containing protein [Catenaria anguillulae PL171]